MYDFKCSRRENHIIHLYIYLLDFRCDIALSIVCAAAALLLSAISDTDIHSMCIVYAIFFVQIVCSIPFDFKLICLCLFVHCVCVLVFVYVSV